MLLSAVAAAAQPTLEECRRLAREHYPEIRRYDLIRLAREYTLSNARRAYLHSGRAEDCLFPCEGAARHIHMAVPIISAGDVAGAVALLSDEKSAVPSAEEQKALAIAAAFLAKQMES